MKVERTYRTRKEQIEYFRLLSYEYQKQAHRNDNLEAKGKAEAYELSAFELEHCLEPDLKEEILKYLQGKFDKYVALKDEYGIDDIFVLKYFDELESCVRMAQSVIKKPISWGSDHKIQIGY